MEKANASTQSDAAVILSLENKCGALEKENVELKQEVDALKNKLSRLYEIIANQQRARFGQSSEKSTYVLPDCEQLRMFNEAENEQDNSAPEPTETTLVAAHERKKKKTIDELAQNLPTEKILVDIPEEDRVCDHCGGELKRVGEKFVRRELEIIPRQVKVLEYYTVTYACPACENKSGYASFYHMDPPPALLKHSLASPSSVANVMAMKYADGIPLARQEKIWKRDGIELSRATLANWMIQTAQTWLKPLYRQMKHHLLEQNVIHADETVIQVLKEEGKAPTAESRMWVYASAPLAFEQIRIFEYQPDRSGKNPAAFLKDFKGCLVTDGYPGYNAVSSAAHCGCWAHMRRYWRDAMPEGATLENSKAASGYEYCNKIFALERKFQGYTVAQRLSCRKNITAPILEAYWNWIDKLDPDDGSKLKDAVVYARHQKESLCEFMNHGEVEISNNTAENAIRPFVVGRKNWLFSDTPKGADSSAIIYSLVESAKANDLEPYAYLKYLLENLRFLGKNPSNDSYEDFMPWSKSIQNALHKKENG